MTKTLATIAGLLLFTLAILPAASAGTLQKDLTFTINEPVSMPDGSVIAPGTYELRFVDPEFRVAAITHEDGTAVGQYFVTRVARPEVSDHAAVLLGGLPNGHAALVECFFPDDNYGFKFNYKEEPEPYAVSAAASLAKK